MSPLENKKPVFGTPLEPDSNPQRPRPTEWDTYVDAVSSEWDHLLGKNPPESEIQNFLELHPAMIPGGSGDIGPGGNHRSEMLAVFRRPRLQGSGRSFEPDFMWITRSSGLVTPILIEIERPGKRWFQANDRPTAEFRDAHDQLNDWRNWFDRDGNKSIFRKSFLFEDRYEDRPLEPQFVLIYGRESEFEPGHGHSSPSELRCKRDSQRVQNEHFMSFDSLKPKFDHSNSMTVTMTARGPRPFAFSPVYGTSTWTGIHALRLGDPSEALGRSVMMTDERKNYLAQRWEDWRQVELNCKSGRAGTCPRRGGRE